MPNHQIFEQILVLQSYDYFLKIVILLQGTRMEERLDDAINVLRNHAESQLGLGQLPPNLGPSQMTTLGYAAPPPDPHLPDPVKVERATYNTSKFV